MTCPSCAREIRVTDGERASGRGFCLVCGARFELAIERTGALMRAAELAVARPATVPARVAVVRNDAQRLRLVVDQRDALLLTFVLALPVLALMFAAPVLLLAFPLILVGVGLALLPERLGVEAGHLVIGRRRIPAADVDRLYVDRGVALVARLTDGTSLPITRRPLPAATLDWLRARIDERLRR